MWAESSGIYFQLAAEGSNGNIDIMFTRIDGPGRYVGYTSGPYPGWSVPMFLDIDENWIRDKTHRESSDSNTSKLSS